jgi:preprotein translocase subunit SecG
MSHSVTHIIYILLCVVQFFVAVGLIVVVTMQDSKNHGRHFFQGQGRARRAVDASNP